HVHGDNPPAMSAPISFNLLLNLVSASNADDKAVLWGFICRYAPDATPESASLLDQMAGYAVTYYHAFVKPGKSYRSPTDLEREALEDLNAQLGAADAHASAEDLQSIVYSVGKAHGFENLRDWFGALYEVLLGQSQGPRFGSFIALYGVDETRAMIAAALEGKAA
ncbi:MAG: lysine--tRNA ligase, partial [Hyphomicrobiaceae bacterium]